MAEVFVDTSGWATYFVRTEPHHTSAFAYMRQWRLHGTQVITTNYILTELIALMTSPLRISHPRQVSTIETLKAASWVEVVHIDPTLDAEAWTLLGERFRQNLESGGLCQLRCHASPWHSRSVNNGSQLRAGRFGAVVEVSRTKTSPKS